MGIKMNSMPLIVHRSRGSPDPLSASAFPSGVGKRVLATMISQQAMAHPIATTL
jgi:hypothetical protein